ncbi:DUF3124 domain-containing protein [Trichocoleus sp. FACHB-262]|uniref:DUF3124 domain-containing protein n=1 Tax=Trichocoleus sp. FACHB-262 TaxID=2692869 RepID=UPI00168600D1|nr:DUF3124 domain-containing protein [Trichocoleus sp. FACHB-262]MBD2119346.1 DUF3124 domain-containing protein [Trichocoleus sp. FACHB-262]
MRLKHHLSFAGVIGAIAIASCSPQTHLSNPSSVQNREIQLQTVSLNQDDIVMGQIVYVPIYSHIYHHNSQDRVMNLSATLSVRNTDSSDPIIITAVRYYDTEGQLIRQEIERPVALKPLASTSFFVAADDTGGGSGANFVVEWVAEKTVSEPVIEAVMINTSGGQGISFISPGKVVEQHGKRN